ncbi:MAG: hypothetical protein LBM20_08605 [Rikenellaceae bacterium]|jgi:hypothetical protein|nr:hypothetical protein [Rikenellaceae bacterium]
MNLPYIIEVQICIALFWVVYRLFMRRSNAFGHNRAYLLGAVALAFILPALSIPVWPAPEPVPVELFDLGAWQDYLDFVPETPMPETPAAPHWEAIALWVYLLGVAILLGGVARHVLRMRRTVRRAEAVEQAGVKIVCHETVKSPYSFFRYIFINPAPTPDNDGLSRIVAHEMAHIRLGHSYDSLFVQGVLILFWWNPFVWLWCRSLKEVHEYQADAAVLDLGVDTKQYITLLIGTLADIHPEFVSGFSYSLLKNRLLMMTRTNTRRSKYRIALALPTCALLMTLFSFTAQSAPQPAPQSAPQTFPGEQANPPQTQTFMTSQEAPKGEPLIIVNGDKWKKGAGSFKVNNVETWVGLNPENATATYGSEGENGAYLITTFGDGAEEDPTLVLEYEEDTQQGVVTMAAMMLIREGTPLYFLDGERITDLNLLPNNYASVTVLKKEKAIERYGEEGKYGAILYTSRGQTIPQPAAPAQLTVSASASATDEVPEGDPLLFIDGEKRDIGTTDLTQLDITSVSVIKNKSILEVYYGEEGKNGVVLITTRQDDTDPSLPSVIVRKSATPQPAAPAQPTASAESIKGRLVVVDGVKMEQGQGLNILPDSVESISFLRKESATEIYGEEGKNGAILITTRKHKTEQDAPSEVVVVGAGQRKKPAGTENDTRSWFFTQSTLEPDSMIRPATPLPVLSMASTEKPEGPLLVFVDGVEMEQGFDPNSIDISTVESIRVVTAEGALETFGEKGRYGAIHVFTKKSNLSRLQKAAIAAETRQSEAGTIQ